MVSNPSFHRISSIHPFHHSFHHPFHHSFHHPFHHVVLSSIPQLLLHHHSIIPAISHPASHHSFHPSIISSSLPSRLGSPEVKSSQGIIIIMIGSSIGFIQERKKREKDLNSAKPLLHLFTSPSSSPKINSASLSHPLMDPSMISSSSLLRDSSPLPALGRLHFIVCRRQNAAVPCPSPCWSHLVP